MQEGPQVLQIAPQVCAAFLQPAAAILISGLTGNQPHHIELRIPGAVDFFFKVGSFRIAVTKDTDVYTIWADSLIYDRCFMNGSFRRYITHVGRKDGRPYLHSAAEVDSALGDAVLEEFDVSPALAAEMGNHAWLLKADTDEQRRQQIRLILEEENAHET